MFLRSKRRFKDGKEHRYRSIVENRRCGGNRVVQRQVLYLGEINDEQRAAWCKTIEVVHEGKGKSRQVAIFPEDREVPKLDCDVVQVKLNELQLKRPRQWGACWLFCVLWDQLGLDDFWGQRLGTSRQGTRWLHVFKTLVAYRLIDPGSEWCLHRQWFEQSAMGDLLGEDYALVQKDKLRQTRRREGRYLLRSNLTGGNPATLWEYYIQLTQIVQAFKELTSLSFSRTLVTIPLQ